MQIPIPLRAFRALEKETMTAQASFVHYLFIYLFIYYLLFTILDINECTDGTADCGHGTECINLNGSFACQCQAGFLKIGDNCTGKHV